MTVNGQSHADKDSRPGAGDQAEAAGAGGTVDKLDTGPDSGTAARAGRSHHRGVELHQRNETAEPDDAADSDVPLRLTPLIRLAEERPPKISAAVRKLRGWEDAEERAWFEALLQQTVPERAWEILQLDNEWEQVLSFAARFSVDHFPLCEGYLDMQADWLQDWRREEPEYDYFERSPYNLIKEGIPFQLMGFSWEEQHEMWDQHRHGMCALALLAAMPAHGEFAAREFRGMREAWLESASDVIPAETLKRLPEGGIPLELLEEAVRNTPLEAAPLAGRWVHGRTETFFLDECFPEEYTGGYSDPWDVDIIEYARQEWSKAKAILDRIEWLSAWLDERLPERFGQMLDFILERLERIPEGRGEKR